MRDLVTIETPRDRVAPAGVDRVGVLLHGFGASAQDLVPLAAELATVDRWILPHAPYPLVVAGLHSGRAWFPSDRNEMERALYGGYFRDLRALEPADLPPAVDLIDRLIDRLATDPREVILGGFSQGAIVAAELLRRRTVSGAPVPETLLLFSGSLIAEPWWLRSRPTTDSRVVVFQSHGRNDAVLPFDGGIALREAITRLGVTVRFHEFSGGHEIPREVVDGARTALARSLGGPSEAGTTRKFDGGSADN